jgi:hypothetical protein
MKDTIKVKRLNGVLTFEKKALKDNPKLPLRWAYRIDKGCEVQYCFSSNEIDKILMAHINKKALEFTRASISDTGEFYENHFIQFVTQMNLKGQTMKSLKEDLKHFQKLDQTDEVKKQISDIKLLLKLKKS